MSAETATNCRDKVYQKVTNAPGLYRHVKTGNYIAVKKINGKHREHSLATSDRKIAERRQREWADSLCKVDSEVEKTTLKELINRFVEINSSKVQNTQVTNRAIINRFLKWWPYGYFTFL